MITTRSLLPEALTAAWIEWNPQRRLSARLIRSSFAAWRLLRWRRRSVGRFL